MGAVAAMLEALLQLYTPAQFPMKRARWLEFLPFGALVFLRADPCFHSTGHSSDECSTSATSPPSRSTSQQQLQQPRSTVSAPKRYVFLPSHAQPFHLTGCSPVARRRRVPRLLRPPVPRHVAPLACISRPPRSPTLRKRIDPHRSATGSPHPAAGARHRTPAVPVWTQALADESGTEPEGEDREEGGRDGEEGPGGKSRDDVGVQNAAGFADAGGFVLVFLLPADIFKR